MRFSNKNSILNLNFFFYTYNKKRQVEKMLQEFWFQKVGHTFKMTCRNKTHSVQD